MVESTALERRQARKGLESSNLSVSAQPKTLSMNPFKFIFGKTSRVKLVEDYDFPEYLKRIGAFDDILSGTHFCASCGVAISLDNIEAIIPGENGNFRFICDRGECLKLNHD